MAEPLALTLSPSTAISADGSSTAVAITGLQRVARCTIDCTVYGASALVVTLERRPDTAAAWETTATTTVSAVGSTALTGEVGALTRVSWTITGTATFGVRGTAYTVYAGPSDITRFVATAAGLDGVATAAQVDACLSAADEVDGYLNARYTMPLTSWGDDLRRQAAAVAAAVVFNVRGANPDGPDALIYDARSRALQWLDRVQAGRLAPPGLVDSTPTVYEAGIAVASRPKRNWH